MRIGGARCSLQDLESRVEDRQRGAEFVRGVGNKVPLSTEGVHQGCDGAPRNKERDRAGEENRSEADSDGSDHDVDTFDIDCGFVVGGCEELVWRDLAEDDEQRSDEDANNEDRYRHRDPDAHSAGSRAYELPVNVGESGASGHSWPRRYPRPRTVVTMSASVFRRT